MPGKQRPCNKMGGIRATASNDFVNGLPGIETGQVQQTEYALPRKGKPNKRKGTSKLGSKLQATTSVQTLPPKNLGVLALNPSACWLFQKLQRSDTSLQISGSTRAWLEVLREWQPEEGLFC